MHAADHRSQRGHQIPSSWIGGCEPPMWIREKKKNNSDLSHIVISPMFRLSHTVNISPVKEVSWVC